MRSVIIIFLCCLGSHLLAQTASNLPTGNVPSYQPRMEVYSWAQRPDEDGSDIQKKFIKQEWTQGTVRFKSGRPDMEVPMIFDIHNDMAYYKLGNDIMEFVDPVLEFDLLVPFKKDSMLMRYRKYYPAIQANTEQTFYQVLVEGKIQLLKCRSKTIQLFKDADSPEEKKKEPTELYFAYMPGKKIVQIDFDAAKLVSNMSEYEWAIKEIIKKEKIKLKDEGRLVDLFILLNSQFQ